jgi:murein DD-endopeptidase MepM/ murein hydrolase activator NlpD
MRHTHHPLLRGAVAVVLVLLLALAAPAAGFDGLADSTDTDPVGVWPLVPQPAVVDGFDPPDSPYGAGHRGVDLAGAPGQPVRTALPGTVTYAGPLAGRGVVVVEHGSPLTTSAPVAASVSVGAVLAAGDRIGTLQLPGSHCFPRACLHWGWIRGETYLDPLRLVGAGPVRLLPLWRDEPATDASESTGPATPHAGWSKLLRLLHQGW